MHTRLKIQLFLLVLLPIVALGCSSNKIDKTVKDAEIEYSIQLTEDDALKEGLGLVLSGRMDAAHWVFTQAIAKNPKNALLRANRARTFTLPENEAQALYDLDIAIREEPNVIEHLVSKAQIYWYSGKIKESSVLVDEVILRDSTYAEALYMKSVLVSDEKKPKEALRWINKSITYAPNDGSLYDGRGRIYWELKEKEKACSDWSKALKLGVKDAGDLIKANCK